MSNKGPLIISCSKPKRNDMMMFVKLLKTVRKQANIDEACQ